MDGWKEGKEGKDLAEKIVTKGGSSSVNDSNIIDLNQEFITVLNILIKINNKIHELYNDSNYDKSLIYQIEMLIYELEQKLGTQSLNQTSEEIKKEYNSDLKENILSFIDSLQGNEVIPIKQPQLITQNRNLYFFYA